jgi:hypothetical protein
MRHIGLALIALGLLAGGARAASPEDDYVAARDKDIARIQHLVAAKIDVKKVDAEQSQMLADLQKRLEAMVGPFVVAGYPAVGKSTLETLSSEDIGFGQLDGIVHSAGDDGPQVIVTTRGLVDRWLRQRAAEKDAADRLPADLETAARADDFYTFSVSEDAAFGKTAELTIAKPAGADFVVAALGGFAQDIGPNPRQEIVVTLQKNGRVYIASQVAKTAIAKIDACEAVWTAVTKKSEDLRAAYQKSGSKDEKLFDDSTKAEDQGEIGSPRTSRAAIHAIPPFVETTAPARGRPRRRRLRSNWRPC